MTPARVLATLGAAGVILTLPPADLRVHAHFSAAGDALARYERGEYEKAVKPFADFIVSGRLGLLLGATPAEEFLADLETTAPKWIEAGGPAGVERRRMVAAAVALEAASYASHLQRPFIEWACELLRASVPGPGEHEWWLASVALLEDSHDWTFLQGAPLGPGGSFVGTWVPLPTGSIQLGHLIHARERYPGDARFKLAGAVGLEFVTRNAIPQQSPPRAAADRLAVEMIDVSDLRTMARVAAVERAIGAFEALRTDAAVGAEASLRLGYCNLRLGRRAAAIAAFDRVAPNTTDRYLMHLSQLLKGWALDQDGRHDEAAAAYRSALEAVPHARTASTLFTASLVLTGRGPEAESVSAGFLSARAWPEDPWPLYPQGDARFYEGLLKRLREAIK